MRILMPGITRTLKAMIKRRSAIEPRIGHMKMEGRLDRNPLKGSLGDALHEQDFPIYPSCFWSIRKKDTVAICYGELSSRILFLFEEEEAGTCCKG